MIKCLYLCNIINIYTYTVIFNSDMWTDYKNTHPLIHNGIFLSKLDCRWINWFIMILYIYIKSKRWWWTHIKYMVNGWLKATGNSDSDDVCRWSAIIDRQDRWYQRVDIYMHQRILIVKGSFGLCRRSTRLMVGPRLLVTMARIPSVGGQIL